MLPIGEVLDMLQSARRELTEHVRPRDHTERLIINALGDISWDEAVRAIEQHRLTSTVNAQR